MSDYSWCRCTAFFWNHACCVARLWPTRVATLGPAVVAASRDQCSSTSRNSWCILGDSSLKPFALCHHTACPKGKTADTQIFEAHCTHKAHVRSMLWDGPYKSQQPRSPTKKPAHQRTNKATKQHPKTKQATSYVYMLGGSLVSHAG